MKNKISTCQMIIAKGEKGGWLTPRKLSGGSTSGATWEEVMTNPPSYGVKAKVTNSGRVQFEKDGEEVMMYVLVRPELTPMGKAALAAWEIEQEKRRKLEAEKQEEKDEKLSQIMLLAESIGLDAALKKLEE